MVSTIKMLALFCSVWYTEAVCLTKKGKKGEYQKWREGNGGFDTHAVEKIGITNTVAEWRFTFSLAEYSLWLFLLC